MGPEPRVVIKTSTGAPSGGRPQRPGSGGVSRRRGRSCRAGRRANGEWEQAREPWAVPVVDVVGVLVVLVLPKGPGVPSPPPRAGGSQPPATRVALEPQTGCRAARNRCAPSAFLGAFSRGR